jgi:hypothetical protein
MALIIFLVGTFGAPIYFDFVGDLVLAPVLLAIAIAAFAVATDGALAKAALWPLP